MRCLIDECLHESLVGVAHDAGFEATHVNHLGLSGAPDWELGERDLINSAIEVSLQGKAVKCVEYPLPEGRGPQRD